MKWNETIAATCRYGDVAARIWGTWDIIWEDSQADYQGHASFLARSPDGRKWAFYEWWYGSCSGCDGWEADGATDDQIEAEMRKTAMWFKSKKTLQNWLTMLEGRAPLSNYGPARGGGGLVAGLDILSGGVFNRINAVRKALGMEPLERSPKEDK